MQEDDNPYEILGVETFCPDEKEIKKAYRKLAIKFHPDKQTTEEDKEKATAMFAKIAEAYETVTDPVKRYDWREAYESKQKKATAPPPMPRATSGSGSSQQRPVRTQRPDGTFRNSGGGQMVQKQQSPKVQPKHRAGLETTNQRPGGRGGRGPAGRGPPAPGLQPPPPPKPSAPKPSEFHKPTKKCRDPFLIFEEVMTEEFGQDYKSKIVEDFHSERAEAPKAKKGLFGKKDNDKLDLPSYKDMFKEIDLNGDKVLSRIEMRKFIESNEMLYMHLSKSLKLNPQQAIDIATDVAFSLAKWDGKDEDVATASYFLTQQKNKSGAKLEMTKDEFKKWYNNYVQSQKGSYDFFLRTMFAAYDLNGDGKLQRKEFENFLEIFYHANYEGKAHMPHKSELVRVAQVRLDKNKDGNMSYSEVRDLLAVAAVLTEKPKKQPPPPPPQQT